MFTSLIRPAKPATPSASASPDLKPASQLKQSAGTCDYPLPGNGRKCISEAISRMVRRNDQFTGRVAVETSSGTLWWVDGDYVTSFLERHGHADADRYRQECGSDWEQDFLTMSWRALRKG